MELTQDLGYIPDYPSQRQHSEQIGYIGICGKIYPVKYGRNTIGRHPDSDIFIDTGSISKLHAVINISNKDDIKLMDCGSLNRSKIRNKTLTPYQACPLQNFDTVQFGSEQGMFRLYEDTDDELPETQQLPLTQVIPDTPVPTRLHQRVENFVIPESPDIDDELIFRRPSDISLNKTPKKNQKQNVTIHDLETQLPTLSMDNAENNFEMDKGQITEETKRLSSKSDSDEEILFEDVDDIEDITASQTLIGDDIVATVATTNGKQRSYVDENDVDIHEVLTQILPSVSEKAQANNKVINNNIKESKESSVNDIECNIQELPSQIINNVQLKKYDFDFASNKISNNIHDMPTQDVVSKSDLNNKNVFDMPTQIISVPYNDVQNMATQMINTDVTKTSGVESSTLQNDVSIENLPTQKIREPYNDVENMPTQIINNSDINETPCDDSTTLQHQIDIKDLPTQIICDIQDMPTQIICSDVINKLNNKSKLINCNIEDLPTQKIPNDIINKSSTNELDILVDGNNEDELTQIINVVPHVNNMIIEHTDVDIQDELTQIIVTRSAEPAPPTLSTNLNKSNNDNEEFLNKNTGVTVLHKSGSSDLSSDTPKKKLSKGFVEQELPNTQEIKTSVNQKSETRIDELTSESEEDNSKENTPVLFRPKKRVKKDITLDFTKSISGTKVSTRTRKPTLKLQAAMADLEKKNTSRYNLNKINDSFSADILEGNLSRIQNYDNKDTEIKNNNNKSVQNNTRKRNSKGKGYCEKKSHKKPKEELDKILGDTTLADKTTELPGSKNEESKTNTNSKEKVSKVDTIKVKHEQQNERKARTKKAEKNIDDKKSKIEPNKKSKENKQEKSTKRNSSRAKKSEKSKVDKGDLKTVPVIIKQDEKKEVTTLERNQGIKRKFENEDKNKISDVNKDNLTHDHNDNGLRRSKRIRNTTSEKNVKIVSILKKPTENISNMEEVSIEYGTRPSYGKKYNSQLSKTNPFKHINEDFSGTSLDLRTNAARIFKTPHILFSAFPDVEKKRILAKMGAIMATDVRRCTVLATCNFTRTFKILCAIGLGKPIVGDQWFKACVKSNTFIDPWQHIVKDNVLESRYKFNLKQVLRGKRNFLKGYTVTSTPTVAPTKNEMKLIVECSGGTWGESKTGKWLCITCERDSILWADLRKRGAILAVVELILGGVLKQELDLMRYVIG